jgi:hypothetical protein
LFNVFITVVVSCHEHNSLCESFAYQVLQLVAIPNIAVSRMPYWRLNRAERDNCVNAEYYRTLRLSDLFVRVVCHIKRDFQAIT